MHDMEDGVRSVGGVVKKKNSSGCLIIKKKGDGIGGFGASASNKVFDSRKEKKRPRLILSDSGSSDELLEPIRRKVVPRTNHFHNGSIVYKEDFVEERSIGKNGLIENERKRRGLDLFEFDEYDGLDGKKMRKDFMDDRLNLVGRIGNQMGSGDGSSINVAVDKRKHSYFDSASKMLGGRSKGANYNVNNMHEMEDNEARLPISLSRDKYGEASVEPIRLQGKNGVLKVMVNKKKLGLSHKSHDHQEAEDRKGSRSEKAVKKHLVIRPSFYLDPKVHERPVSFARAEKSDLKLRQSLTTKSSKPGDSETYDSDMSLKLGSMTENAHSSMKVVKSEGKRTPPPEDISPVRAKEAKVKRGTGTEKQLLREKIRKMLLSAGWKIDYRPRRNRDYLDAVYINRSGTAYWSIIKAYEAFQKQLEEEDTDIKPCGDSSPFTPVPEEILSKLTRQTRKKIEREMKKKRRDGGGSKNAKEATVRESVEGTDSVQHEEKLSFYKKQNRKSLKGRLHVADHVSGDDSSGNLYKGTLKGDRVDKASVATNSHMIQGRKSRKIGRCTLLVRSSDKGLNSETDGFVPYTGKRTLLSWLIDSGIVHTSERVQYMNRRKSRVMLEGWITRDGIHCGCCSKILSISKFEIHAGSKQRQPFANIFLESGLSLMQCQIEAWNRQEESERRCFHTLDIDGDDPNDDTCGLCGDGGDLICCDGCPSTFHQSCLDIQMLPPGDWYCQNCTCKFCGISGGSTTEASDRTAGALLMCCLCEKKYHESCSQEMDDLPIDSNSSTTSFCGQNCRELFGHLQKLLGVKHELEAGFSWSLIQRMDPFSDTLHLGFSQTVECNSKLAVALSVMDECFLPIFDRRSGINLIHNVLYNCGSNFSRLNYSGFYTAILERGDEIISAASIRIHGTQLAEMPFIGTRHIYRRQGMCRRLFCAIESVLCSLKVEKLIIPAIAEHMHTWTEVFNFQPIEELHKQEMRSMNMLVFPGTDMLQKLLVKREIPEGNITSSSVTKSVEVKENTELDSSAGHDVHACDDARAQHVNEIKDKVAATDSGLQAPAVPYGSSVTSNSVVAPFEPKLQFSSKETISINSQSANKVAESAADLKCPPHSDASPVILETGNPVLVPPVKNIMDSSGEGGGTGDAHEASAEASCIALVFDSLGEPSAKNIVEAANENHNLVAASTVDGKVESTMQYNYDLNHRSAVDVESKLHVASEVASGLEVAPVEGNIQSFVEGSERGIQEANVKVACVGTIPGSSLEISAHSATERVDENQRSVEGNVPYFAKSSESDAYEVKVDVSCVGPVPGSLLKISAESTTEEADEKHRSVSFPIPHCTREHVMQLNLNQPSALEIGSELHVASQLLSDAKVDTLDVNIQSFAVGEVGHDHEDKVACVEPALDSFGEISTQKTTDEKMVEKQNPRTISTFHGTGQSITEVNPDSSRQTASKMEGELHVASEVLSDAKVDTFDVDIQSSAVGEVGHDHEAKVACVEPALDSFGEISSQKTTDEKMVENQNPIAVSTFRGTGQSITEVNPDSSWQTASKVEGELHVASELLSDAKVDTFDVDIQSSAVGEVGHDHEAKVACVEPALDSFGEISTEKTTDEKMVDNQNPISVSTFHGTGQTITEVNPEPSRQTACDVQSEIHVASELLSDAKVDTFDVEIHSSAVGDVGHVHEAKVACVEPALNSFREISTSISGSTFHGNGQSVTEVYPELSQQTASKVESELLVASEEVSDEVIAPAEVNIQSNGEDEVDVARKLNVKVACIEPVHLAQNATQAIEEI